MTEDMNKIDKLFKDGFEQASQTPPGFIWGKIADSLGIATARKQRILIWYAAASIALMAAFTSGYYLATISSPANGVVAENEIIKSPTRASSDLQTANKNTFTETKELQHKIPVDQEIKATDKSPRTTEIPVHYSSSKTGKITAEEPAKSDINKVQQIAQVEGAKENQAATDTTEEEIFVIIEPEHIIDPYIPPIIPPKVSRWIIGGNMGPQYAYRDVRNDGGNIFLLAGTVPDNYSARSSNSDKSYYDQIESPIIAFSGGMNVQYLAAKRLFIESGVYFSRTGQITDEMFVYEEDALGTGTSDYQIINSSAGDVVNNQKSGGLQEDLQESHTYVLNQSPDGSQLFMNTSNLVLNFDYLEVPLILKYKILDRTIDVLLAAGINSGVLVGNNAYVQNETERISLGKTENIRTMSYSGSAGFEVQYELNKHFSFKLEPVLRYALRPINKDYYIRSYPYSFQVLSGLNYNF